MKKIPKCPIYAAPQPWHCVDCTGNEGFYSGHAGSCLNFLYRQEKRVEKELKKVKELIEVAEKKQEAPNDKRT